MLSNNYPAIRHDYLSDGGYDYAPIDPTQQPDDLMYVQPDTIYRQPINEQYTEVVAPPVNDYVYEPQVLPMEVPTERVEPAVYTMQPVAVVEQEIVPIVPPTPEPPKKDNTLLLVGGGLLIFFLLNKKKKKR